MNPQIQKREKAYLTGKFKFLEKKYKFNMESFPCNERFPINLKGTPKFHTKFLSA